LKVVLISGEYKTISRVRILKHPSIYLEKLNSVNKNAEISDEKCKKRAFTCKLVVEFF